MLYESRSVRDQIVDISMIVWEEKREVKGEGMEAEGEGRRDPKGLCPVQAEDPGKPRPLEKTG